MLKICDLDQYPEPPALSCHTRRLFEAPPAGACVAGRKAAVPHEVFEKQPVLEQHSQQLGVAPGDISGRQGGDVKLIGYLIEMLLICAATAPHLRGCTRPDQIGANGGRKPVPSRRCI